MRGRSVWDGKEREPGMRMKVKMVFSNIFFGRGNAANGLIRRALQPSRD